MSSAARDPAAAPVLPPLTSITVAEAQPAPGTAAVRQRQVETLTRRIEGYQEQILTAIHAWLDRMLGVTESRLAGPRVRKGTRWWSDSGGAWSTPPPAGTVEVKALDAQYALPDRTAAEIADVLRPVGLRIAADVVAHTADQLGRPNVGLAAYDQQVVDNAVDSVVQQMLGLSRRHAETLRRAILGGDETAADFDTLIRDLREAHRRGAQWMLMYGRTLATALAGEAALAAAAAMGATQTEWRSRRDDRVRHTHVAADGQIRDLRDRFQVGRFRMLHPADPTDLPASWPEVGGCRCGLVALRADLRDQAARAAARSGTPDVAERIGRVADSIVAANGALPTPPGLGLPATAPVVRLPAPLAGYRELGSPLGAVVAGQWLAVAGIVALSLTAPVVTSPATLTVVMPAGMLVGVVAGTAVLPEGTPLRVVSVDESGAVVAVPVR